MNDILEIAAVLFLLSTSIALPPAIWLWLWRAKKQDRTRGETVDQMSASIRRLEEELAAVALDNQRLSESTQFLTKMIAERSRTRDAELPHPGAPA